MRTIRLKAVRSGHLIADLIQCPAGECRHHFDDFSRKARPDADPSGHQFFFQGTPYGAAQQELRAHFLQLGSLFACSEGGAPSPGDQGAPALIDPPQREPLAEVKGRGDAILKSRHGHEHKALQAEERAIAVPSWDVP